MPTLHLVPSSLAEQAILALVLAGFGSFVVTLFWVSISVALAQRATQTSREIAVGAAADPVVLENA